MEQDQRFARFKTDPRFRRPRKKQNKITVDQRFKSIFDTEKEGKSGGTRIDKYGRRESPSKEKDNLRRFYRLEDDQQSSQQRPDYARGEGLVESSDEEVDSDPESDFHLIALGRENGQPITIDESALEIDLDESQFPDLDAQATVNAAAQDESIAKAVANPTRRLAIVNLDWDHVRASHLFKIFSSLLSPTAPPASISDKVNAKGRSAVTGSVLSVRVYPSEFGKQRMEREDKEGPPVEVFQREVSESLRDPGEDQGEDEVDEESLLRVDSGKEFDEDALRKYQLERLRYYYAIATCDSAKAAAHIYHELEGTELERSANIFDLSYVPDDMDFDDKFRDEATEDVSVSYKAVEFVTDALRHSKVKLTWDDDDPERSKITRRKLSRKEIEEDDFKAYLASSASEDEDEQAAPRDKNALRAILLGNHGDDENLPEGWGEGDEKKAGEMEITFTPALGAAADKKVDAELETTLERYQRKQREKKAKKKKVKVVDRERAEGEEEEEGQPLPPKSERNGGRPVATEEELSLIVASDQLNAEPQHFDLKAVIKAEKGEKARKRTKKKIRSEAIEDETGGDFVIDVKDERFKALHEDHAFAIDPSNPRFKKTKAMSALLEEHSKRPGIRGRQPVPDESISRDNNLERLVESVKRKSQVSHSGGSSGKRRKQG